MQSDKEPLEKGQEPASDPEVRGPSLRAGLYLLPAFIVLMFVAGWLFVFSLLHESHDPQSLVEGMQQPGRRSWQKAYALSQLLLDPDNDHLKDDVALCRALVSTLEQQNRQATEARQAGEPDDPELAQFRSFLCRALGEFRLLDGLPVLLETAAADRTRIHAPGDLLVQQAAIEAIAVLASNVGPETLSAHESVVETLADACRTMAVIEDDSAATGVASAATFALGVIGGPQAIDVLLVHLSDPRLDVRYNAATGLARQGRAEAVPVVLEMLAADNLASVQSEKTVSAKARKQGMVMLNGIQAAVRLLPHLPTELRDELIDALQTLSTSSAVPARVRIDAKQALLRMGQQ